MSVARTIKRFTQRDRALRSMVLALATACVAVPASGQRPLPFDSVAALSAPAPDHRIAYGPGPLQFGNLRLPKRPGPHPVVLFIHGGCFLSQYSISHVAALEQAFADSGYAVWSIEYRRVGDDGGGWPGTFDDVARAADHLRSIADQYSLDLAALSPPATLPARTSRSGWRRETVSATRAHCESNAHSPSARCSRSRRHQTWARYTRKACATT